SVFAIFAAL
nr:Chain C, SER-VAL-PHE-ALA-ILE-PHE-ALA-ALA-LEU [Cryptosporidium parvum]7WCY_F Chain F, SER-VAL-PHE-ALA-ILE-PHE-ALA-ALA-LEU [Cryptosporidium parvum]